MRYKKVMGILLSAALLFGMCFPGVLTVSAEQIEASAEAVEPETVQDYEAMSAEQLYELVLTMPDDQIDTLLAGLSEEKQQELLAYAQSQVYSEPAETVEFTDAGPFLPPVPVAAKNAAKAIAAPRRGLRSAATGVLPDNGLELLKSALKNENGGYTITVEAYTTGTVTTTETQVPVDIVLVLDQSGSMADNFDGKSTSNNTLRRQYAMKQAVNNFISAVNEKYSEEADHRMAIVTFDFSAAVLQTWTSVDAGGKTLLQGKINGLPQEPEGATRIDYGMTKAQELMGTGYSYTGANVQRQKVVIVFTDGVPTSSSKFETTVADSAISTGKGLKDSGVTIYTIGIFNGANPDELYGASGFDTNSDGTVGSKWIKDTWGFFPGTDFPEADRPAGNRFLNYLSGNFPTATSVGLRRDTSGLAIFHYEITYEITDNHHREKSNYYLTAADAEGLNRIFTSISQNIQSANINLGSQTVIKDVVTPYFNVPEAASKVRLYTAAAQAGAGFAERRRAGAEVVAAVDPKTRAISVTGFDFNANFVSETQKEDGSYGSKLIIEFDIVPREGFLGGNNVPTNVWEQSAVYSGDTEVEKLAGADDTPKVNVPIKSVSVTAVDKNVYLYSNVDVVQLKTGATATVDSVSLNLTADNYGLEPWQMAYVTIEDIAVDTENTPIAAADLEKLTQDRSYKIALTISPRETAAETSSGAPAVEQRMESDPANIHVFKPVLTFKDSEVCYGDAVPADYNDNQVGSVLWKHGETNAADVTTMLGAAPALGLSFTPEPGKISDGRINTKQDIGVDVVVKIGEDDVTQYSSFVHMDCAGMTCHTHNGIKFLLHVKTCTLTITKNGGADGEPYVFTIFKDGRVYTELSITGNGSKTIYELPVGEYRIVEDRTWSWRYTGTYDKEEVTLSGENTSDTIACSNSSTIKVWLNSFSDVLKNAFGITLSD